MEKKPMTVLEALVLDRIGWRDEYQRRMFVEAQDVLHRAAEHIRRERLEPLPPLEPVDWT